MATNGNAAANGQPEEPTGNPSHRYLSTRGEDSGVRFALLSLVKPFRLFPSAHCIVPPSRIHIIEEWKDSE